MANKPKTPEGLRGLAPNLFVYGERVFPTMGKTSLGQPDGPNDGVLGLVCILLPCVCSPRRFKL